VIGLNDGTIVAAWLAARHPELCRSLVLFVSSTVKDLLAGSRIGFEDRLEHELKGVPGTWRLFAATQ
jgi:pimeloyl-ACP methyl ester carboxylesterase